MNNYCIFNEFSWNSKDLCACVNTARMILRHYGSIVLFSLAKNNSFGNLDIDAIMNDEQY